MSLEYEEEIAQAIVSANFSRSYQLALDWLNKIPAEAINSDEWSKARFAYLITRFFLHRQERITNHTGGSEKARFFLELLHNFESYLEEIQGKALSSLILAARFYCHSQIADGLAKELAGQRSYNLNPEEIFQLAISLIEIEKITAARDVLQFLYQMNPKSPKTLYLLAYVLYRGGLEVEAYIYLRQALFYQPEIVLEYPQYLVGGKIYELYQKISQKEYSPTIRARHFALLAELYGLYPNRLDLSAKEALKLKDDYRRLFRDYEQNVEMRDELFPRIAHYLCWLIEINYQHHNFDAVEEWRQEMRDLDQELWQTYAEHHNF